MKNAEKMYDTFQLGEDARCTLSMDTHATLLIQSESQLADIYGNEGAKTIINNCDTYIYLGGMDIDTSKSIAARLNRPYPDVLAMPIAREYFFHRGQRPVTTRRKSLYEDVNYLAEINTR